MTEIMVLDPKAYNWKNRQQVKPIIKEVVHTNNDKEKTLGLSYTKLITVLIKAIQEQQTIIVNRTKNDDLIKMTQEFKLLKAHK